MRALALIFTLFFIGCGADPSSDPVQDSGGDVAAAGDTGSASDIAHVDAADLAQDANGDPLGDVVDADGDAEERDSAADVDLPEPPDYPMDDELRVNHIQARCTHNSYHVEVATPLDPSHRFTHLPLDEQLELQGVRGFELDIHPGEDFPVYHIPLFDDVSTCADLVECLADIRGWSDRNPGHHLLFVWLELKDELDPGRSIDDYDALDAALLTGFPRDRILTPDDVQGDFASPREAIMTAGWPTLGETRDMIMFMLLETESEHSAAYTYDHTTLAGRVAFVSAGQSQLDLPWAAVAKINDPTASQAITNAHARHILVASNVGSADTSDERAQQKRLAGLANGVHMLCDDTPAPSDDREYWLDIPDGQPSRCNPVSAPVGCGSADIEAIGNE